MFQNINAIICHIISTFSPKAIMHYLESLLYKEILRAALKVGCWFLRGGCSDKRTKKVHVAGVLRVYEDGELFKKFRSIE